MTQQYTGTISCDDCGTEQEFELHGDSSARAEVTMWAERKGWQCDGEDLCVECQEKREEHSQYRTFCGTHRRTQ